MPRVGRRTAEERREHVESRRAADTLADMLLLETDPDVLDQYKSHPWSHVRAAVAGNRHTRPETLAGFFYDSHENPRAAAAENPNTPEATLIAFANSKRSDWYILRHLVANPSRTAGLVDALSRRSAGEVNVRVANDPLLPVARMKQMSRSKNAGVLAGLIVNPAYPDAAALAAKVPVDALMRAFSVNAYILFGVPQNTQPVNDAVLDAVEERLEAEDVDPVLLDTVAKYPHARPSMIETVLDRGAGYIVMNALQNPNCPEDRLRAAFLNGDTGFQRAVLKNPNCPEDVRVMHALQPN